jgi:endoglucanase
MERLVENQMTNAPNAQYLTNLTQMVNHVTSKGAYAVLDPHNYGRYYGNMYETKPFRCSTYVRAARKIWKKQRD